MYGASGIIIAELNYLLKIARSLDVAAKPWLEPIATRVKAGILCAIK
jgi:hypothetical protein